jgi:hypothetical protein
MVVKYGGRTGTHEVRFFLKAALNYIPELEGMFEERTITPNFLVPLHRGYDGLKGWQDFWVD